jgi:hypothetical protein
MSNQPTDNVSPEHGGAIDKPAVMGRSFFRPKTRGELADALRRGEWCEVAGQAVEFTNICLDGWLKMEGKYRTLYSPNRGWILYEPLSTGP